MSRRSVSKYVAAAEAVGIRPGDGHAVDRAGWAARVAGWFPELVDARARSRSWPTPNEQRALIESMLATNTLATVHQRLRDEHGLAVSQSSLRRYVALELPERSQRSKATVLRPDVPPGEAQIDYGYLGSWVDPLGGRVRRVHAFVMVLACSRHMFVRPVLSMDQERECSHMRGDEGRSGPGGEAQRQAAGRAHDAVPAGLVLARAQLRQRHRHADSGGRLVP